MAEEKKKGKAEEVAWPRESRERRKRKSRPGKGSGFSAAPFCNGLFVAKPENSALQIG